MTTTAPHQYSPRSTHTQHRAAVLSVDPAMAEHLAALHPDLRAAVLSVDPAMAEHLAALHPDLRAAVLTHLPRHQRGRSPGLRRPARPWGGRQHLHQHRPHRRPPAVVSPQAARHAHPAMGRPAHHTPAAPPAGPALPLTRSPQCEQCR